MGQQQSTDPNLGRIVKSPVYFIQFKASSIAKIFCFKRGMKKGMWALILNVCGTMNSAPRVFQITDKHLVHLFHHSVMHWRTAGLPYTSLEQSWAPLGHSCGSRMFLPWLQTWMLRQQEKSVTRRQMRILRSYVNQGPILSTRSRATDQGSEQGHNIYSKD